MAKKIETILLMIIFTLLGISFANSTVYYDYMSFSFEHETPDNIALYTFECDNSQCSQASAGNFEYFSGDAITCWNTYGVAGDSNGYNTCMNNYRLNSNILDLSSTNSVFVRYPTENAFGYVTNAFSNGDNYHAVYRRTTPNPTSFDTFVYTVPNNNFFHRTNSAIAEISQVNLVNTENPLAPIQVRVPIEIEETVCSAFRTATNVFHTTPPSGYDDYSADTQINLEIRNEITNELYHTDSTTVSIDADQCVALAEFYWTPGPSAFNQEITFSLATIVVDEQVSSSLIDTYSITETVYPEDLTNTCYARIEDFTVANVLDFDITSSTTNIVRGETLYAMALVGAFSGESSTPIPVSGRLLVNGVEVANGNGITTSQSLDEYSLDITNIISNLAAGSYTITLEATPDSTGCTMATPVTHNQNLNIFEADTYEVGFRVFDENSNPISGANINLNLVDADDYYVNAPSYSITQSTDLTGRSVFTGALTGDYTYTISANGFATVNQNVYVGGDVSIDIYLNNANGPNQGNTAPQVNIPDFNGNINEVILIDIRDYIYDFNDDINDLTITSVITSGNPADFIINQINDFTYTITSGMINASITYDVTVTDPFGASDSDTTTITFTNSTTTTPVVNQAPTVISFVGTPDIGTSPLTSTFTFGLIDLDGDSLTCELRFGDGTDATTGPVPCSSLNGATNTYTAVGLYTARLRVYDGINSPVNAYEVIEVTTTGGPTGPICPGDPSCPPTGPICPGDPSCPPIPTTNNNPVISTFTASPNSGISTLFTNFAIAASDVDGDTLTCTINTGDGTTYGPTLCGVLNGQGHFYSTIGVYTATLTVNDGNGGSATLNTIINVNSVPIAPLNPVDVIIDVDDVIEPGEFAVTIIINNESLEMRSVKFRPVIICDGIENKLKISGGVLPNSLVSSRYKDSGFEYRIVIDTDDFKLNIPKDQNCVLRIEAFDDNGSNLTLEQIVMFSYPQEVSGLLSVRGKGTDVMNFMQTSLLNGVNKGYNLIAFNIANNEEESKEISITVMSPNLDFAISEKEGIKRGETREMQIPVYISKDTKSGLYPIRISVHDGENHQTRYTFIKVN